MVSLRFVRPTLFDFAGGADAMLRLARAHHARCVADPELGHAFSHPGQRPDHVERLAAYWGEVLGGPADYTGRYGGSQSALLAMHAGNGDLSDLNRRFVDCFVAAMDDAGLPDDEHFRTSMRAYMTWATFRFNTFPAGPDDVPPGLETPAWTWIASGRIS